MADEADIAARTTDTWLAQALSAQRATATALKPRGSCHNCEREFSADEDGPKFEELLYCDVDCRKDHELRVKHGKK